MAELDRLWAPWRSTFVGRKRRGGCIFCQAKNSKKDSKHHVILRGNRVFSLLNRYPYSNGHLMIAPYRHVGGLDSLSAPEWTESLHMCRRLMQRAHAILHPHGWNIGLNLGQAAGAGIPGHLHLHLVPRWKGDTNFMTTVSDTKVISQALDELYERLTKRRASGA
jgi:ATP adenylyltransferase